LFVAAFIGSPPMNLVEATLERSPDGIAVAGSDDTFWLSRCPRRSGTAPTDGRPFVGIRRST
jgi:hypothetical protein